MLVSLWSVKSIKYLTPLKDKVAHWSCVIYEWLCSYCNLIYIGETKRNGEVRCKKYKESAAEIRTYIALNKERFSQVYLESIVGCTFKDS